jgi:hypothetical protein
MPVRVVVLLRVYKEKLTSMLSSSDGWLTVSGDEWRGGC